MRFGFKKLKKMFHPSEPPVLEGDIRMISGCDDAQTSADIKNVTDFDLPDPAGKSGGACTSTLLDILYADNKTPEDTYSFVEVLEMMREKLREKGYDQIPQLTASHPIDVNVKFDLVPDDATGNRRALLVGINYVGHPKGVLNGCHNDVKNMVQYIKDVHGFEDENITILMDDGEHTQPTKEKLLAAYKKIVAESSAGDSIFCHYSGHGVNVPDDNGDEEDGLDEALVPVDYREVGIIRDDDLYEILVKELPKDVHLVCLMDCCHSGTVLDLPYVFKADGSQQTMKLDENFNFDKLFRKVGKKLRGLLDL